MRIFQAFLTYRDKLAFIAGSTAAFGEPADRRIPEDILLAIHDALDIGLYAFVILDGNCLLECPEIKKV